MVFENKAAPGHPNAMTTPDTTTAIAAITLRPEPRSVGRARHFVARTLRDWGHADLTDAACLLTSEIMTNAVCRALSPIDLCLHHNGRGIVTEITDDSSHLPQPRLPELDDENGRGLMLVETLADAWGTRVTDTGKTVWFTLAVPPAPDE